MIKIAIFPQ